MKVLKVDEDYGWYFIRLEGGDVKFQRKEPISAGQTPLWESEKLAVALCQHIIEKQEREENLCYTGKNVEIR